MSVSLLGSVTSRGSTGTLCAGELSRYAVLNSSYSLMGRINHSMDRIPGGALANVRLVNAPICIEVPHVCRFFAGVGQKRRRHHLNEGHTAAFVHALCFSIGSLLHFQKVRLVERPHGSRVPPVVSSAWWQWASLERVPTENLSGYS